MLHRFDPESALEKSGIDYLVVTSHPVATAVKGQKYHYPLAVKSKKGGVKMRLDSGPQGMKLTPGNELTWVVPVAFADREWAVIVTISDASGQEILHNYRLSVMDKAAA